MANKAIDHLYGRRSHASHPAHFDDCCDLGVYLHWAVSLWRAERPGLAVTKTQIRVRCYNLTVKIQLIELSLHLVQIGSLEAPDELAVDRYETRPGDRLRCLPFEAVLDLGQREPMMLAFGPDGKVGGGEAGIGETAGVNADH